MSSFITIICLFFFHFRYTNVPDVINLYYLDCALDFCSKWFKFYCCADFFRQRPCNIFQHVFGIVMFCVILQIHVVNFFYTEARNCKTLNYTSSGANHFETNINLFSRGNDENYGALYEILQLQLTIYLRCELMNLSDALCYLLYNI